MASLNYQVSAEMGFAPLDLVDVPVGRLTCKLYPKLTSLMPVYERAHAFQVNKTALNNARGVEISQILDALGSQMNSSSTVEGLVSMWRRHFQARWFNLAFLTVLSFHRSNGDRVDDTTVAGNPSVLLPLIDGPAATCRKQDIKFVRVRCTLNFGALILLDPYPVTPILRVEYYIELPQAIRQVRRGNNDISIETFAGRDDITTYTPGEMQGILEEVQQDAPMILTESEFNLQAANTNSINLAADID